jgi:hypothetical protein
VPKVVTSSGIDRPGGRGYLNRTRRPATWTRTSHLWPSVVTAGSPQTAWRRPDLAATSGSADPAGGSGPKLSKASCGLTLRLGVSVDDARTGFHDTAVMTDPNADRPRVYLTVPGVEDLTSVIIMLRGAGATITPKRREFVVEGRLTAQQAAAVWQLAEHVDSGSESYRLDVRVDPSGDLKAALDVMCPGGWTVDAFDRAEANWSQANRWWMEQQQLQRTRRG